MKDDIISTLRNRRARSFGHSRTRIASMKSLFSVHRLLAVSALLFGFAAPAAAQSGTITGRVTDQGSGQAIQAARLQISQTGQVVNVRPDGRYTFPSVAPGTYDVRVIAVGYAAQRKTAT